ncbi:hypothetical protein LVJ94_43750 [Pendulispora rubella]|uniref:Uncharacterized protein n=1 Tax=Pendulispora rubella TaxID=2741070 RepID=A0ABZ2L1F5_9BACT
MRTRSSRLLAVTLLFGAAGCFAAACGSSDASPSDEARGDASVDARGGGENDAAPGNDATTRDDAAADAAADGAGQGGDAGYDGGDGGWHSCVTGTVDLPRTPAYARIVLDGSRRMDGMATTSAGLVYVAGARDSDSQNRERPTIPDGSGDIAKAGQGPVAATGKKWLAARSALNSAWSVLRRNPPNRDLGIGFHVINGTTDIGDDQQDIPTAAVGDPQMNVLTARTAPVIPHNGTAQYPIGNVYPSGDLPLLAAINGQGRLLQTFDPASADLSPGGRRYLLLIVNGTPSDDNVSNPDASASVQALARLRAANPPVTTFVIGLGDPTANPADYDEVFLGHLAKAGGGTASAACNPDWAGEPSGHPCHFQVTPGNKSTSALTSDFVNALFAIQRRVVGCDFALPSSHPAIDPTRSNIVRESASGPATQIPHGPANGWTFDNDASPTLVRFYGNSCQSIEGDSAAKVRLVLGCKTDEIVIPVP